MTAKNYIRQICIRPIRAAAAIAILTTFALTAAPQDAPPQTTDAPKERAAKDQGEFDISNEFQKDLLGGNGAKAIDDLNTWKQKYPDSDFANDREADYVHAYLANKQFDKALDKTKELMAAGLDKMFPDPKTGPQQVVKVLFNAVNAVRSIENPTPDQIDTGKKAADMLLGYSRKPVGIADAAWADARKTLNEAADAAKLRIALLPGMQAEAKKDCPAAEAAWTSAVGAYPDNTAISYHLAQAYNCNQKPFLALYEYARTAAVDPTMGKTGDGAKVSEFVKNTYVKLHGSDEGYDALLNQAKSSPLPPADFKIVTAAEIDAKKADDFAKANPELATWKNIKDNLVAQGAPFFENMKGAELPQLLGVVADAKPACRPKTLTVYVPMPDNTAKTAEITLKFETALSGKPDLDQTIKFTGVGDAFTASPFMLTLTVDKDKVQDLKMSPCAAAAPAKKKK